jgi:hypothetical protein
MLFKTMAIALLGRVENVSSEIATILFFFNKPAFEQCHRAMSSCPGEKFSPLPPDKMKAVRTECHEVMKQTPLP